MAEIEDISNAWIRFQNKQQERSQKADAQWAVDVLNRSILSDPEYAFNVIKDIYEKVDDEWVLVNLSAGPIETLLDLYCEYEDRVMSMGNGRKMAIIRENIWR